MTYKPQQRVRSRGEIVPVPLYTASPLIYCNGQSYDGGPVVIPYLGNGETETMVDYDSPGFYQAQRDGRVIINPMTHTRVTASAEVTGSGVQTRNTGGGCGSCTGYGLSSSTQIGYTQRNFDGVFPEFNDSDGLAAARTHVGTLAMANIQSPEFLALVFGAEMHKTWRMLRRPFGGFENILRHFLTRRPGFHKDLYRNLKELWNSAQRYSRSWLEFRYGWLVLMLEIEGALKAYDKKYFNVRQRYTARASSQWAPSSVSEGGTINAPSTGGWSTTWSKESSREYEVKAGVLYEAFLTRQNSFGLSLSDVPQSAWELIPWSFVVDWFVNVGDYITAVTPRLELQVLASWTVVKRTTSISFATSAVGVNPGGCSSTPRRYYTWSGTPGHAANVTEVQTSRTPGVDVGVTSLFHQMDISKWRDRKRAADAVALILTMINGKLPRDVLRI